jgi:hypothetical protein
MFCIFPHSHLVAFAVDPTTQLVVLWVTLFRVNSFTRQALPSFARRMQKLQVLTQPKRVLFSRRGSEGGGNERGDGKKNEHRGFHSHTLRSMLIPQATAAFRQLTSTATSGNA